MKHHFLSISSFAGLVWGAYHCEGIITSVNKTKHTLKKILSSKEAAKFNKTEKTETYRYKAGDEVSRFESKEELLKAATDWFNKNAKPEDVLFLGDAVRATSNPVEVIVSCPVLKKKAESLLDRMKKNNGWSGNQKIMMEICDEWSKLWGGWQD